MKAKLQPPRSLQGQEQFLSSSPNSISSASSIRVSKKSNYSYSKTPRQPTSLKKSSRVESMLQDSQCIILREQLENSLDDENKNSNKLDFSQIETNQLNRLISHLREYTQHCAVEGNYAEARRSEYIGSRAKSVLEKRTTKIKPTVKIVEDQKESRSNFERIWQTKFNDYENETNEKREKLQKKHAHETRVFERIWAQEMPQKYRKPSQRLLQLMQVEKSLAISGEIDRADYIHTQVVKQTQIEMENAQANLIHDYQVAKAKHFEKQSIETSRFEQARSHGKDLLDADYRADKLRVNHRDVVVQMHVKESILRAKMDQTPPTRSAGVPKNRDSTITSLLPRLVAPNDPSLIKNERMRRKQIYGKQQEFQRKTIESLQAESNSSRRQNQTENSNTNEKCDNQLYCQNDIQKVEKKRKRKRSKNDNDNEDFSENGYYYSDEAIDNANLENGTTDQSNINNASFDQPHYNTPLTSETGFFNQNNLFESSGALFSDTNPKARYQEKDENKNSVISIANNILNQISVESSKDNNNDAENTENQIQINTITQSDETHELSGRDENSEKVQNDQINENMQNNGNYENNDNTNESSSLILDKNEVQENNINDNNSLNVQIFTSQIVNNLIDDQNQKESDKNNSQVVIDSQNQVNDIDDETKESS